MGGSVSRARAWPISMVAGAPAVSRTAGGQIQQPQQVGDRDPGFAHGVGHLLLGELELFFQPLQGGRFFQWIQVLALDVLDERHGRGLFVADFPHQRRDPVQARHPGGPPAAFAGNQLEPALRPGPDHDGLHQALGFDGRGQFRQALFGEVAAGLVAAPDHIIDGHFGARGRGLGRSRLGAAAIARHLAGQITREQGVQPAAESFLGHADTPCLRRISPASAM